MKKAFNEDVARIIISVLLFTISLFLPSTPSLIFLILSYLIISYEIYIKAYEEIKVKEIFNENFLMIIATIGAFAIGSYQEAVMVMLLFEIGEYLSDLAVANSKKSITKLMDLRSETINLLKDNEIEKVSIKKAKLDDIFVVLPGEKVALDGIVIEGTSYLDTSSLTGESTPRKATVNDLVLSGTINKDSILKVKATSTYKTSTATRIIDLIENSNNKKTDTENYIRKFSKIYTPIIVALALIIAIIPSLITGNFQTWLYRALVFLVTSCPCALVISVPLGYFSGIGRASKEGILIKGSRELERLANIDYLALDKTGTITEGVFEVTKVESKNLKEKEFIQLVASAEANSIHPIAKAIVNYNKEKVLSSSNHKEYSGKGISSTIDNKEVLLGNKKLMDENNIKIPVEKSLGTIIYVAIDNKYEGYIVISDRIKKSSYKLSTLKDEFKDIMILSGDNEDVTSAIAKEVKIKTYYNSLLPVDKVNKIKEYQKQGLVMFIGDGINDAPVIKISDIGVSMGNLGSDAAIEASDIVIMQDDLSKVKTALNVSKLTKHKVKASIIFALIVKFIVLALGIFGISTIWMAVFADVGVTLLTVLNVLTILWKKV